MEAGTGTGKSAIAATLANMYESSYILTATKQLQQQYLDDFEDYGFVLVKGRGNFKCREYNKYNIYNSCEHGRCNLESYKCSYKINIENYYAHTERNSCDYYYQKVKGLLSPVVITNYAYAFLDLNYDEDGFGTRKLMICDEAHNVENQIMNLLALEFSEDELKEDINLKISKDTIKSLEKRGSQYWISFIERVIGQYKKQRALFDNLVKKEPKNINYRQKLDLLKNRIDDLYRLIRYIKKDPLNWVFSYDKVKKVLSFKPVTVDKYARSTLFKYADICIFMSATILDEKLFAKWLGINKREIYAIRRKSPFDVARNPIKTYSGYNMSRKYKIESLNRAIPTLRDIINEHKNEKGIIHTHSHDNKKIIYSKLSMDESIKSRLISHESYNRERKLKEFIDSNEPLILISPSMGEGVDLPGDLCRFQIMVKIPYPNLGDMQIRKRTDMEDDWYKFQTTLSLVQTYGRGMRSENDYCKSYFIDSGLDDFIQYDATRLHFIPDFFKEAINITQADVSQNVDVKSIEVNGMGICRTKEGVLANANKISKSFGEYQNKMNNASNNEEIEDALSCLADVPNYIFGRTSSGSFNSTPDSINIPYATVNDEISSGSSTGVNDEISSGSSTSVNDRISSSSYASVDEDINSGSSTGVNDVISSDSSTAVNDESPTDSYTVVSSRVDYGSSKSTEISSPKIKHPTYESLQYMGISSNSANISTKSKIEYLSANDFSNSDKINQKYSIVKAIGEDYYDRHYNSVLEQCKSQMNNDLFKGDYYPYKMIIRSFDRLKEDEEKLDYIKLFFESGIYCNDTQALWFENELRKVQKSLRLDKNEVNEMIDLFNESREKMEKEESVIPISDRIKLIDGEVKVIDDEYFEKLEMIDYIKMQTDDLRDRKKYQKAIDLYNKAIDEGLVDFRFYQGLYACHMKLKDYKGAEDSLNKFYDYPPIIQKPNHRKWILRKKKELDKKRKNS